MTTSPERTAWLEERRTYIGATDLSAILGLNPYSTPLSVYCDKLGIVEPQAETHAMKRGLRLEPYIAQLYSDAAGWQALKWDAVVRHGKKPHLAVNPDYWAPTALTGEQPRLIECKSHLPWLAHYYGEPGTDQAPDWEVLQAQWQCHLTNFARCDIAVLLGLAEEDFRIYTVAADPEIGGMLEEAGDKFWQDHILAQVPPPVTGMEADTELLKRLYPTHRDSSVIADEAIDTECERLRIARRERKRAEADELKAENAIKAYMGDAAILESSLGTFTWRTAKGAPKWKAIAETFSPSPALIEQHTGAGARRFLTPFGKGE